LGLLGPQHTVQRFGPNDQFVHLREILAFWPTSARVTFFAGIGVTTIPTRVKVTIRAGI
jgi:hypothetical protein